MYATALVAIDFSPATGSLLKRLQHLRLLNTRKIVLLHVLANGGDAEDAREWAERVRAWAQSDAEGWLLEAEAHLAEGDVPPALEAVRHGLAADPLDAEARYAYGRLVEQLSGPARGGLAPERSSEQWRLALEIEAAREEWRAAAGRGATVGGAPRPDERAAAPLEGTAPPARCRGVE